MVLTENSSTMNLLQDSDGNINIHEIKASTSGTKIISNNIFNHHFSSSADNQKTLPNKYVDITAQSQTEKDILLSLDGDELGRMVTDMVEQEHTLQIHSNVKDFQQSVIDEQSQLLSSYNNILDLPKNVQQKIIIKPIHKIEISNVNFTQEPHKSHLLPWISNEYTKLIRPRKDCHVVTKKKKQPLNVLNQTNATALLSHEVIKKGNSNDKVEYHKDISNYCIKLNNIEENKNVVEKKEETKELSSKCEVTITRIRGDKNGNSQYNKEIKMDSKHKHQENVIPQVTNSLSDALNLKSLTTDKELLKLENLREVAISNSNENIVLYPPIPILSAGDLPESKPGTSTDNNTQEQMIMIQELKAMVPPNIYPQQSFKKFENGKMLLVAPLSTNENNHHGRLIKPKGFVSNIKSDLNGTGEEVIIKDSAEAYRHYTSIHGSMPMLAETGDQYNGVGNNNNKRKMLDDSLLCDIKIGIEKKENLHYEDSFSDGEKKKRCRNGFKKEKKWQQEEELSDAEEEKKRMNAKKAKEHREKKKDEIHALKSENMQWQLKCRELEAENKQLKSQVEMLKSIFPMLNVNSLPGT